MPPALRYLPGIGGGSGGEAWRGIWLKHAIINPVDITRLHVWMLGCFVRG